MKIGEFLNLYRTEHHMTMEELANRCNLSKAYISKLEANVSDKNDKYIRPSIQTFNKIADGLNISLTDLLSALDDDQEVTLDIENEIKNAINNEYLEKIKNSLDYLNDTGKKEAVKRIEELTYIPLYADSLKEVAARSNSSAKIKLNDKHLENDIKKPMSTGFDD